MRGRSVPLIGDMKAPSGAPAGAPGHNQKRPIGEMKAHVRA